MLRRMQDQFNHSINATSNSMAQTQQAQITKYVRHVHHRVPNDFLYVDSLQLRLFLGAEFIVAKVLDNIFNVHYDIVEGT